MALQLANALSQIKLNESQANKNEAEANKIKGVDTEAQQATIDNLIAQTSIVTGKHDGMLKASKKELTN